LLGRVRIGDPGASGQALIAVVDIASFSPQPEWLQVEMVRWLLERLEQHSFWVEQTEPERRVLDSRGDGYVLGVSTGGRRTRPRDLCAMALEIAAAAREFRLSQTAPPGWKRLEVRVGIHLGCYLLASELDGVRFAVGSGLNGCSRIAGLGGPGQVVLSEEFWTYLAGALGPEGHGFAVHPEPRRPPLAAGVQHGVLARFRRIFRTRGRARIPDPPRVRENAMLDEHLSASLEVTGRAIAGALEGRDPRLDLRRLQPRLSVWGPAGEELRRLPYVAQLPQDGAFPPQDRRHTRYALPKDPRAAGEGPVVEAWLRDSCVVVNGLPKHQQDPVAYREAFRQRGIAASKVDGFGRHPRALLAVALPLLERPAGVLCVDRLDPLEGLEEWAGTLLRSIRNRSGYYLASLITLRMR
jgi:hypothetical protein